jgi:hypothetical protein
MAVRRPVNGGRASLGILEQARVIAKAAGDDVVAHLPSHARHAVLRQPGEFYHMVLRLLLRRAAAAIARENGWALDDAAVVDDLRIPALPQLEWAVTALLALEPAGTKGDRALQLAALYQILLELSPQLDEVGMFVLSASGRTRRSSGGSYFTPPAVVEGLLDLALEPLLEHAVAGGEEALFGLRVCDPACGAGAFLVAAARRIAGRLAAAGSRDASWYLREVMAHCIYGVDVDAVAVELCRLALWLCAPSPVPPWRFMDERIRIGDALLGAPTATSRRLGRAECDAMCLNAVNGSAGALAGRGFFHWSLEFPEVFRDRGGFDLLIGNPPFLNRLEEATAAEPAVAALLRSRFGGAIRCYADAATAFLMLGVELARPGGRCALIQPQSVLAARDAGPPRCALARSCTLEALWVASGQLFDAGVRVCAPILVREGPRCATLRLMVDGFEEHSRYEIDMDRLSTAETWSTLVAAALGVPKCSVRSDGIVGDLADATADFRDQFYGLRGTVVEDDGTLDPGTHPRLVTTGVVDLASCAWGYRSLRFDGQRWRQPRVNVSCLEPGLQRWADSRLQPKIIVPTQTRIIEGMVDEEGVLLPATPLISVVPRDPALLWRLAAAICAPPVSALAMHRHAGAALSGAALKLSARQVAALPLPKEGTAWTVGAALLRRASAAEQPQRDELIARFGSVMCRAYGLHPAERKSVLGWWRSRLAPAARRGRGSESSSSSEKGFSPMRSLPRVL